MLTDSSYGKFKYILYYPDNDANLPLIVVLHGSGEIGSSLDAAGRHAGADGFISDFCY